MIPTSGVRQLHNGNLCKIAAFSNSTMIVILQVALISYSRVRQFYKEIWYQQVVLDNSTMEIYAK